MSGNTIRIKNDSEACLADNAQLSAAPETEGKSEINILNCSTDGDNKEEKLECEMSSFCKNPKSEPDLHNPGDCIERPDPSPANCDELSPKRLIQSCAVCTYPCWNCRTTDGAPRSSSPTSKTRTWWMNVSKSTPESMSRKTKRRKLNGEEYVGPEDNQFVDKILNRCGLGREVINRCTVDFYFPEPQERPKSKVFLDLDDQEILSIAKDFEVFSNKVYDENRLAFMLVDSLLKRDHFPEPMAPRSIISLRRDKWRPQRPGPPISGPEYYYDWKLEQDITYMVSTNMFHPDRRRRIAVTPDLFAEPDGVCPYFSIDYRSHAKNQITAASMLWLHQRKCIREKIGSTKCDDLRHFGFEIESDGVYIWEVSCDDNNGYVLQWLDRCCLSLVNGVKRFVQWSNAIHAWGLGPNATAFKADALKYLKTVARDPDLEY